MTTSVSRREAFLLLLLLQLLAATVALAVPQQQELQLQDTVLLDDVVQEAYATATEVNGIRRTLDEFMKTQDQQNERVQKNFDDLFLAIQKITGQPSGELPEDKGSTVKVKNKQVYQQPNPTFRHHRSQN